MPPDGVDDRVAMMGIAGMAAGTGTLFGIGTGMIGYAMRAHRRDRLRDAAAAVS